MQEALTNAADEACMKAFDFRHQGKGRVTLEIAHRLSSLQVIVANPQL